ncbi:unnamed protein product [Closterium sp. NIES-65]|nr:unnamed protein product [Closterium sp. NIES-65]
MYVLVTSSPDVVNKLFDAATNSCKNETTVKDQIKLHMDAQRTGFLLSQEGRMASVEHLLERVPISSNGYEYEFARWKRNADGIVVPENGHGNGGDRLGPAFRAT